MEKHSKSPKSESASSPLFQRSVQGGFWILTGRISQQLLALTRLMVLANLLTPREYGLAGVGLLTLAILNRFTVTGFQAALIQKKARIEPYLDSAWTVGILRGLILYAILYIIAPYAAVFFDRGEVADISRIGEITNIIRIMGISIVICAFNNIGTVYFTKELDFKKQFLYQMSGVITDVGVSITLAVLYRNVWALVYGKLSGEIVRTIFGYILHNYRPKLSLVGEKVKELWVFGKWIFSAATLNFLINEGDDIIVGRMLGIHWLGHYRMAYKWSNMPATEITNTLGRITFPVYSKLQDDLPRFRRAFLKNIHLTAFISFPIAGLIFVLAAEFTEIFLSCRWLPMVPAMQILALWGLIRSMGGAISTVFNGLGRPEINTRLLIIKLILLAVLIYPLTARWGIVGTSLAVVLNPVVVFPLAVYMARKMLGFEILDLVKVLILPFLGVLIMIHIILQLKGLIYCCFSPDLFFWGRMIYFFGAILLGMVFYVGMGYIWDRVFDYKIMPKIRELWVTLRK